MSCLILQPRIKWNKLSLEYNIKSFIIGLIQHYLTFFIRYLFLWRNLEMISALLFSKYSWSARAMTYFSVRHRSQTSCAKFIRRCIHKCFPKYVVTFGFVLQLPNVFPLKCQTKDCRNYLATKKNLIKLKVILH